MNRLLTLFLSILTIFCTQAQNPFGNQDNDVPPIKWTGTARLTSATEGVVTLTASMAEGWPLTKTDAMFNIDVNYWEGKVVFTQKFRLNPDLAPVTAIACSVTYMGCNDATCLPPQTKEFRLRILPPKQ